MNSEASAVGINVATSREAAAAALQRARGVTTTLTAAAPQIDADRELPANVLAVLHDARLFRLTLPAWLAGEELAPAELAQVTETVAAADASAGWCLGQAFGCAMSAAFMQEDAAREVFGPSNAVLAWGAGAQGKAVETGAGYRVTGSWKFASGGKHATWLGAHCKVYDADGSPRLNAAGKHVGRTALFPRSAATMADDWYVMGLRGTRSEGYSVADLQVEDAFTLDRETPSECRSDAPLYQFPTTNVYAGAFSGVALGIARGALDDLRDLAQNKTARGARSAMRDSPVFHNELAQLEAQHASARAFQQQTLQQAWASVVQGEPLVMDQRAQIRLATTWAINQCAEIVQQVYRLAGSSAIFLDAPFERRFRDMHAVSQQVQGRASNFETVGAYMLGHTADTLFM